MVRKHGTGGLRGVFQGRLIPVTLIWNWSYSVRRFICRGARIFALNAVGIVDHAVCGVWRWHVPDAARNLIGCMHPEH
ncbi:hypothetical protein XAC908_1070028 [Xanthomonas citri pv. citri]|nr:hypothetical protein XAC908_1070028 [Xanthomonas citri pv. citri]